MAVCVVSGDVSRYLAVVTALEAPGPLFNLPSVALVTPATLVPSAPGSSHADLLLAVVLLSHETLAALSSCFVAHFCKSRLVDSIPSTTDEETSAPLILHHLFSLSPCQGASAHICLYPDVPFQGRLLEKAERWSFLMGKLVDLIRMEEHIPRKHVMFQQSPRDCVCGHKKCCLSYT